MMKITRARFKLAVRYCKQHTERMCANKAAESLACSDFRKFSNTVHKQNNSKVTEFAQVVDGCMGDEETADRWRQHFQELYNSNAENKSKTSLQSWISTGLPCSTDIIHNNALRCCGCLKKSKMRENPQSRWDLHGGCNLRRSLPQSASALVVQPGY